MSLGRESTRPMAMITAYGLDIPEQALSLDPSHVQGRDDRVVNGAAR
jgi:hypothetical protein